MKNEFTVIYTPYKKVRLDCTGCITDYLTLNHI